MGGGPASGTSTRPPNKNYNKIENTKKTEKKHKIPNKLKNLKIPRKPKILKRIEGHLSKTRRLWFQLITLQYTEIIVIRSVIS